ncbi:hypothetical protein SAMN05216389_10144 [Oceanobacillus limi]|uniref:Uncharacterized protein n=1 Tax=Oceanobacillus limi TaxID=930131 RepID=A0A1H9XZQ9_9BACI|nr:hypothetical protein [Oceanobacillus limi]SES61834.1 hypothetical protein SAMN05216389_10144 [Oceanobacillus limi]
MAKRKKNQNQAQAEVTNNAADTEFGTEVPQSKKARKRAARERKKNK